MKTKRKKHSLSRKRLIDVVVYEFHAKSQVASLIPSYNKPTQGNIYPWMLHFLGCYRHPRKRISLGVVTFPWVSSALKKTYILSGRGKVLHFLDVVQNLIFVSLVTKPSRKSFIAVGLQGNLNFRSSLPLAAILDGWPSRIISLTGFMVFF